MLREWEEALDERPEEVKRSGQGKRAAAMQKQTADYLRPLFKQLKSRVRRLYIFHINCNRHNIN